MAHLYPCEQCGADGVAHYVLAYDPGLKHHYNVRLCTGCYRDYIGPRAAALNDSLHQESTMKARSKQSPKRAAKAAAANGHRPSKYSGQTIKLLVKKNPRRTGTWGFKSFEKMKTGMTYEAFIAAGGRLQDLAWDVAHKHVQMVKAGK